MSKYPTNPDNDATLPRVDDNLTEIGGEAINALREAVLALERAVGSNPQGNVADLVSRINLVIDPNGVIKTSALAGKGLVTLPINDAQIASDAAIQESKLDLDYPTASLNTTVAGLAANVASISAATGSLASDYLAHVAGTADKHEASKIIVTPTVRSAANVQAALEAIDAEVVAHEADTTAHIAQFITVSNEFQHISATNVQTALYELDVAGSGAVSDHHLEEHDTGIGFSSRVESGSQFNLRETTMAATIAEHLTGYAPERSQSNRRPDRLPGARCCYGLQHTHLRRRG
jgi:hypothetical protein